ncbi:hypothetical protein MTR_4g045683 [Medicago truncatula]|uniref:Uncharacterized protein n=1 Tax=Medicago truncatula TaxID=3880 RepID=A0A072UIG6_MEDTR|nr:hypothetical protein MTR_4g045683 [Medicago truncatula]
MLRRFPSLPLAGFPCHESPSPRRHSSNFDNCYKDDIDDNDSSCLFDVDYDGMMNPGSSYLQLKFAGIYALFYLYRLT